MDKEKSVDSTKHDAVELQFLQKVAERLTDDIEVLQALAELYTRNGKFKEGLAVDRQLCQRLPSDDLAWYNLGCSYALTNQLDEAFEALTKSVELGYGDYDWMKSDPDLLNLHKDPRFESLLSWLYSACYEEE
ncbi:MAG: tetratricopeptide repeat protein [Pontiellaceae bacterium]|nr:tetratricopeptide repeat protein [Pontiellaceae bacterium]